MKTIDVHNYHFNENELKFECDGNVLSCSAAAEKVHGKTLGIFTQIHYLLIDCLARVFHHFKQRQFLEIKNLLTPTIQEQELFTGTRKIIENFVKEKFYIQSKNVEYLDEAEVICLGESHYIPSHRILNAFVIDTLCENNDLLLTEYNEATGNDPGQAKHVKSPLTTRGWDNIAEEKVEEIIKIIKKERRFLELSKKLPVYSMYFNLCSISLMLQGLEKVSLWASSIALGLAASTFWINRKLCSISTSGLQTLYNSIAPRNRSLWEKVEAFSKPNQRIFVIGGKAHFQPGTTKPNNIAYQEALECLQKKKFTILIPKDN